MAAISDTVKSDGCDDVRVEAGMRSQGDLGKREVRRRPEHLV